MATPLLARPGSPPTAGDPHDRQPARTQPRELLLYVLAAVLALGAITLMARLWRATWSIPLSYSGDAIGAAAMVKTTLETGWYESQPRLGAPFGQHYHDFPFADDLHLVGIKMLGLFTHNWPVVFNLYYILGYPLAALAAVWFLRRCGLRPLLAVVLAVLFAVAPYHLLRNEGHYFLSGYYMVPFGLGLVLAVARGEPLWGLRGTATTGGSAGWPGRVRRSPVLRTLTGRGAGSVVILVLLAYSGAYYAVFVGLLLGAAALFAVLARWQWRRFLGAVVAGGILLGSVLLATVPDLIYEHVHGSNAAAYIRAPSDSERYALKFTSLLLPASGNPIPALAALRTYYDRTFPYAGEQPALGLIGAIGFLILLGWPMMLILRAGPSHRPGDPHSAATMSALSVLTWSAFLISTIGGIGTLVSFLDPGIRGWNRMSVVITLLGLAGAGLAGQAAIIHRARRREASDRPPRRWPLPLAAAIILLVGGFEQSSTRGVPGYIVTTTYFRADAAFVQQIEASVPAGSMIFQIPVISFPEGGRRYWAIDNDQLIGFLHSTTLRWSGGGFRGRPQTSWVRPVSARPPAEMTRDLVALGFAGIMVDRFATPDSGRRLEAGLRPVTGGPEFTGSGGRYAYFSLAAARARLAAMLTPAQQQALADQIVPPTKP